MNSTDKYRVIIAGTRTFDNYELLKCKLDAILQNKLPDVVIIHGNCIGADLLAERYAIEKGLSYEACLADWSKGRKAGPLRNEQMARDKQANACIVFWDGKSRGSKNMIDTAKKYSLALRVVYYNQP